MKIIKSKQGIEIEFSLLEKILGMHGNFTIPQKNIISIKKGTPKQLWWEFRVPGTFLPGIIKAGTYYSKRGKEYWYVTRKNKNRYTVELKNESFRRLVVSTKKPL
jgi:hypothetical protein